MTLVALTYFILGAFASFAPEIVSSFLKTENTLLVSLLIQGFGAFNFAMSIQNWMSKSSLIGGIYNRPLIMANLTYFGMSSIAISKGLMNSIDVSSILWFFGIIFILFTIAFGVFFFKNPLQEK